MSADQLVEVRAPISGHIKAIQAQPGSDVPQGAELALLSPGGDQVWEALRGLYAVGQIEDLPAIAPFKDPSRDLPQGVAQQAAETR